jgi:hypothetical protein
MFALSDKERKITNVFNTVLYYYPYEPFLAIGRGLNSATVANANSNSNSNTNSNSNSNTNSNVIVNANSNVIVNIEPYEKIIQSIFYINKFALKTIDDKTGENKINHTLFELKEVIPRENVDLIVLDRSFDPIAPYLMSWMYISLCSLVKKESTNGIDNVSDVLIQGWIGEQNQNNFFSRHKFNTPDVFFEKIEEEKKEFETWEQAKGLSNGKITQGEVNDSTSGSGSSSPPSTMQLANLMWSLPEREKKINDLVINQNLINQINTMMKKKRLLDFSILQQKFISSLLSPFAFSLSLSQEIHSLVLNDTFKKLEMNEKKNLLKIGMICKKTALANEMDLGIDRISQEELRMVRKLSARSNTRSNVSLNALSNVSKPFEMLSDLKNDIKETKKKLSFSLSTLVHERSEIDNYRYQLEFILNEVKKKRSRTIIYINGGVTWYEINLVKTHNTNNSESNVILASDMIIETPF